MATSTEREADQELDRAIARERDVWRRGCETGEGGSDMALQPQAEERVRAPVQRARQLGAHDAPRPVRLPARFSQSARLHGHTAAATAALTVALLDIADGPPDRPEETAPWARFRQFVLHDADEFHRVARHALGPALDEVYAAQELLGLAMRPEVVRHRLIDLDPHLLAPPTTRDPIVHPRHCAGLLLRGTAWRAAGRVDPGRDAHRAARPGGLTTRRSAPVLGTLVR